MVLLNHSCVDVLKMDIESSEFKIFDEMSKRVGGTEPAAHPLPVCQLLVEFHSRLHPLGDQAKFQALRSLAKLGFRLLHNVVITADGSDNAFFVNPLFCLTVCSTANELKSTPIPEVPIYSSAFVARTNAALASGRVQCDRNYTRSVRVAVGFFGLIRNIGPVLPSILANLLSPISKNGRGLDAFVHTILLDKITCSRNGESNVALYKTRMQVRC